jgi:flagellar biosynthesis/type III secretory pathway M-ring protein FliF/YscJ
MGIMGQLPGTDEAIQSAAKSGWEAVLIVVIVVSILVAFGLLAKIVLDQANRREDRMAKENSELEQALIELTRTVTEATTSARDVQIQTNECLSRFSSVMDGINGDIRELCQLLKDKAICPLYDRENEAE